MGKSSMRNLVIAVGGPMEATDNRKRWLQRIAERTGLSLRVVKAVWHEEQISAETERKLKLAAGKHEAANLAVRFEYLAQSLRHRDQDFHGEDVAALIHAAHALRGMGGTGTDGE